MQVFIPRQTDDEVTSNILQILWNLGFELISWALPGVCLCHRLSPCCFKLQMLQYIYPPLCWVEMLWGGGCRDRTYFKLNTIDYISLDGVCPILHHRWPRIFRDRCIRPSLKGPIAWDSRAPWSPKGPHCLDLRAPVYSMGPWVAIWF